MVNVTLKSCNPNRHGTVRLIQEASGDFWIVQYPGVDEQEEDEFDSLELADRYYESTVERLSKTANWEAQAAYDEEWGTDNGYGAHQAYAMEY